MILVLLGAPGSGKGTQSKRLCARFRLTHLATGDIFRSEMAAKTALGEKAAEFVRSGRLVPDDLVTEMVAARIDPAGVQVLLDGFPRNLDQARALSDILRHGGASLNLVLYLDLPIQEAIRRLSSRRVCASCGEVYNLITQPPPASGLCVRDGCGGRIEQRPDDSEETARRRLMVFEDLTKPLLSYYKGEGLLAEVDAARPPEAVEADLGAAIEKAAKPAAEGNGLPPMAMGGKPI